MSTCPLNCPIKPDVEKITRLSTDLTAAFSKLRRDLKRCRSCPFFEDCAFRSQFNASVQAALTQVIEEWREI
jgi:hypothetical protein